MAKIAYLTIDDGPTEDMMSRVDFLASKEIKALWFCLGSELEKYPEQASYAIQHGHVLGNHSHDHARFSEISLDQANEQIVKTDQLIEEIYTRSGISRPAKLFRFPYLNNGSDDPYEQCDWSNPHVSALQSLLSDLGYEQPHFKNIRYERTRKAGFMDCKNIDCTYDSFDWCLEDGMEMFGYSDLSSVLARIDEDLPEGGRGLNCSTSNEIVLMHAYIEFDSFQAIVNKIESKGIEFDLPDF